MSQEEQYIDLECPFGDARDAIRWADNLLLTPDCKTISGKILVDNVQQSRGQISPYNSRELAILISTNVAAIPFPYGRATRYVYGIGDILDLADKLAHDTWVGPSDGKTIADARALAVLVMEQARSWDRNGRRMSTASMAVQMRLSRGRFYSKWGKTKKAMRLLFDGWVSKGIRAANDRLIDAGVIG